MGRPRDSALIKIRLAQTRGQSQRFDQDQREQRQRRLLLCFITIEQETSGFRNKGVKKRTRSLNEDIIRTHQGFFSL